ncbi:MAG: arylsulfatase [Verrucomicrobiota bacterium]
MIDRFKTGFWLLATVFLLTPTAKAEPRPNIIVIMTDDMGYSDLGCYGSEIETPHLDSLAAGGIRYTQMYNTSKCWTSRISLLTGLYHQRSDRDFQNTALIGEMLRPAGYRTWWSGKHHAGFNPHERGFDHFSGFLGGAINFWNPSDVARVGEPLPGWRASYTWAFDETLVKPFVPEKGFFATDDFTDWALDWLDEERGEDEPFFLFLAYNAPHWPLHAHAEDIAKYEGEYDAGYAAIRNARYQRQLEMGLFKAGTALLSEAEHADWTSLSADDREAEVLRMQIHAAMVDRVDQNIGRLIEKLKAEEEFEDTLILFLVDNGASHERPKSEKKDVDAPWGTVGSFEAIGQSWANVANTPLRRWKIQGLEGGINTPMIAHWPAGITTEREAIVRDPCHLVDLVPTFFELAGDRATYPEGINPPDGISLVPTLGGEQMNRPDPIFFQYGSWQVNRDGRWKLAQRKSDLWELYDLASDRTEMENLAQRHPQRVAKMAAQWEAWFEDCKGTPFERGSKKSKE